MDYIFVIGIGISLLLIVIGAFYAYRCWMLWRRTNISGIYICVTKDRSFLSNNFKYIVVIGALNSFHVLFDVVKGVVLPSSPWLRNIFDVLYYLNIIAILAILLLLAISWYKLLSKVKRWDTHWIAGKGKAFS